MVTRAVKASGLLRSPAPEFEPAVSRIGTQIARPRAYVIWIRRLEAVLFGLKDEPQVLQCEKLPPPLLQCIQWNCVESYTVSSFLFT
jgi:hypothetical protein